MRLLREPLDKAAFLLATAPAEWQDRETLWNMEKKGIISDRCELNRQIKADNTLLRELRRQVKKLAQAVRNTLPALAESRAQEVYGEKYNPLDV